MNQLFRPLPCLFVLAVLAGTSSDALAATRHKQVSHEKKAEAASSPRRERSAASKKETGPKKEAALKKPKGRKERVADKRHKKDTSDDNDAPKFTGDLAALKDAIDLARQGKTDDATAARRPHRRSRGAKARRMVHAAPSGLHAPNFTATPPSSPPIRTGRASRCCAGAPRRGCGRTSRTPPPCTPSPSDHPITAKGRLALARVLLAEGDRDGAQRLVARGLAHRRNCPSAARARCWKRSAIC